MEFILNELSLKGQFESEDDFCSCLQEELVDILDMMDENHFLLYKKQEMYEQLVTEDKTLYDILSLSNIPAVTLVKEYIVQLSFQEPYWDNAPCTKKDTVYEYPDKQEEPNCFTEAIEREIPVISFEDSGEKEIICYKNKCEVHIHNIAKKQDFLNVCLVCQRLDIDYILENYPYDRDVTLAKIKGKCYAKEALMENNLTVRDLQTIVQSIPLLIKGLEHGEKNNYWDSFREGVFEYRVSVSAGRIFRLFFFQKRGLVFLNGFIKKSQKTPQQEIDKAIRLKKRVE
ncbi:MAG: type II toxin-antitoxin system RelE/ParE family toxin [Ruminococcus flavefaciens]|nr:type II toxin-antitoxin system RelE/ParE family toxin [Ruminococcus flavefaciens]